MSAAVKPPPRALFRDRTDAAANTAVLVVTTAAWIGSFALMGASVGLVNVVGVLLCAQAMVLAAYLVHEAAHQTLFAMPSANRRAGEVMSFIAGSSYASFEHIRQLHIRHHVDRADLVCFDFKALLRRHPVLRRVLEALEWAYIPATEILMHLQVVWRPFFVRSQRRHLPRAAGQLVLRGGLLLLLGLWSPRALIVYALAVLLELHVLNFFDAFHHTFDQFVLAPDDPLSMDGRDRTYEQANTYSNLISHRHPWLNLLVLNFGYHNAHHHRPSAPWWRLPRLHQDLYGEAPAAVIPLGELLGTWHRNRVRRVSGEEYGARGSGRCRADSFVGAHGVSFLSVV